MNIAFHGAARTVTGSKHLLTLINGKKILLDCGLFQGHGAESEEMNRDLGFDPASVDFLILSHAHIDHSGCIPYLVKQGFSGPIISTPATRDLATIMLADTAHIMQNDIGYLNKRRQKQGRELLSPLFEEKDVADTMELFVTLPINKPYDLTDGVSLLFTDAGHILGAAAVHLTVKENGKTKRLSFTGDIGRYYDQLLPGPQPFPQADYIICESTYGNRLHETVEDSSAKLLAIVKKTCVEQKGKLIIPAFSLGRTQEIVYALNNLSNAHKLPPIPVYVDSPLSTSATGIMRSHKESYNADVKKKLQEDPDPFGFNNLHYIRRAEESIALNSKDEPMIIISASGMAEAGRIKHHIKNSISNPRNTILIVGFCTPGSLGGRLSAGNKEVRIFGKEYIVKADVQIMGNYSAHGDYNEMLKYLSCQDTSKVSKLFLVHGEYDVQLEWNEKLKTTGFKSIEIPERHSNREL